MFVNPQRHVATELAAAGDSGRSLVDMHRTYHHQPAADLHRVKLHENLATERAAEMWLIEKAVEEMGDQISRGEDGLLRLAVPVDQLLDYKGDSLHLNQPDANAEFSDPFNPLTTTGDFARATRAPGRDNLDELKDSIQQFGFRRELPIIRDERGVILSGRRRLRAAEELGVVDQVRFEEYRYGDGDLGTIERSKIMLASNLGRKPPTAADMRYYARRLYDEEGLTQAQIAARLGISRTQVIRALQAARARPVGIVRCMDNPNSERPARNRRGGRVDTGATILAYLATRPDGATADEVTAALDGTHQNISARIHYFIQSGELVTTGERRPTRTGRSANVVTIAPHVPRPEPMTEPTRPEPEPEMRQMAAGNAGYFEQDHSQDEPRFVTVTVTEDAPPEPPVAQQCNHCCPVHCP